MGLELSPHILVYMIFGQQLLRYILLHASLLRQLPQRHKDKPWEEMAIDAQRARARSQLITSQAKSPAPPMLS
jgi:hypothetical protein